MGRTTETPVVWGGRAWNGLLREAFEFIGTLSDQRVLELGFRDGEMSCAFARLGARVTALEVTPTAPARAQALAQAMGLSERTDFRLYNGDLTTVPGQYDLVFTKSVLVLTDLPEMLAGIRARLRPGGRFVFVENARGGPLLRLLRYCTRLPRTYRGVRYFTPADVAMVRANFGVEFVRSTRIPPVYLICGHG